MQATFEAITALTDEFCSEHLNDEYGQLARQVTAAMCRKRPSPMERGRHATWACGVVYALGFVNFLFDSNNQPYMSAIDLCKEFGVSKSTGYTKSKVIRDALGMCQLDPDWCLPSLLDDNPLAWMIEVNGLLVDARMMPVEIQEIAYEKGLIPYISS